MNKSEAAHLDLLNRNLPKFWDIICLQEPHITKQGNIRTPHKFRQVYPESRKDKDKGRVRSAIWVNENIDTNKWEILNIPDNNDITAIRIKGEFGCVSVFNVYNPCDSDNTQEVLNEYLLSNRGDFYGGEDKHVIWCGDFNRHHQLWDRDEDTDLFRGTYAKRAQKFVEILAEHDMAMALPKGIPTIRTHRSKRYTRPDNVFVTGHTLTHLIRCEVDATWRPPNTDHFPIVTVLDLPMEKTTAQPTRNYRMTDWEEFREAVLKKLESLRLPGELDTVSDLEEQTQRLTEILQETIDEQVPYVEFSPYMKRWWSKELEKMKKTMNRLSRDAWKERFNTDHPTHREHKVFKNKYAEAIFTAKKKHWEDFLEEATEREMWIANKYIKDPVGDGGNPRIPTLYTKTPNGRQKHHDTNEAKAAAFGEAFFPPRPKETSVPTNQQYPEPFPLRSEITAQQVTENIKRLAPYKAAGPDGIPNVVLKETAEILADYLADIFRTALELGHFFTGWKTFTTIILRKPGRPSYEAPKAYRPIALLCTMGKLLTAIITEEISRILECEGLLPDNHYGGRPCRTTTDAVHHLVHRIKEAWRKGYVASVLYLDVEGAFPNAVTDRLIHNMKKRRVPTKYIGLVQALLTDRRTQLKFDDHTSAPIPINNGIGQGDPISMLIYLIYNADLMETPVSEREDAIGYVDDACFIAIGKTFTETTHILANMMEREGGGFEWSENHNSNFALDKLAVTHFARTDPSKARSTKRKDQLKAPELKLRGTVVKVAKTYKYLGVHIDNQLLWKEQTERAVAKATKWVLMFKRLAQPSKGISQKLMRKLYLSVAVPKMTYALDVWYDPPHLKETASKRTGSVRALKELAKVQRIAALAITGALRTTPNDLLDAHAGLLPLELMLEKTCHRNITRLCTLPKSHPVLCIAKRCIAPIDQKHLTNLHLLIRRFNLDPKDIETINPPKYTSADPLPVTVIIDNSRKDSIRNEEQEKARYKIYSDGSGQNGQAGAAAVLMEWDNPTPSKILRYHLGPLSRHTTYEAEAVGAILATHLMKSIPATKDGENRIVHYADNQSIIKALRARKGKTGQYLIENYRKHTQSITQDGKCEITLRWISAHSGVPGNEAVDEAAKQAAEGDSSDKDLLPRFLRRSLPASKAAIKQAKTEEIKRSWSANWSKSPRYERMKKIDPSHPYRKFRQRRDNLSRAQGSILTQIRCGHIPLNTYLKKIGKRANDYCNWCRKNLRIRTPETVNHFILDCQEHKWARAEMNHKLGRSNSYELAKILNTEKGIKALLNFINDTKRFRDTHGQLKAHEFTE